MYQYNTRTDYAGKVSIVGRVSRPVMITQLNIPVTPALHHRLREAIDGSLATGGGALIDWALDELERQGISLEARLAPE